MKTLREYQLDAVNASIRALTAFSRNVIIAPTGAGKSLIIAHIAKRALKAKLRVLVLAPKGFLLTQNVAEFLDASPSAVVGIYCAGLNRKDTEEEIIFATRDSLGRNPTACGSFDLILCDECHSIPIDVLNQQGGMYHEIFKNQDAPFVIGLTATPWRLDGGLVYGSDNFFTHCSYRIKLHDLISKGYLSDYTFPTKANDSLFSKSSGVVDTSKLKVVRGDYQERDLDDIMGNYEVIDECIDIWLKEGGGRQVTLFFTCSRYHASRFMERISSRCPEHKFAYIDGDIIGKKREKLIDEIKSGAYKGVVNIGVLVEGFDADVIDCVMFCRPTASVSLHAQMAGRGLRKSLDKTSCLFLDVAGNFDRFKCLNDPVVYRPQSSRSNLSKKIESKEWKMPVDTSERDCVQCGAHIPEGVARCFECYDFRNRELDMVHDPYSDVPIVYRVRAVHLEEYTTKTGEDCVRVHYQTEGGHFLEYLLINRKGQWWEKARNKYKALKNYEKSPATLQVENSKKSKYKILTITSWNNINRYAKKSNRELCKHPWVELVKSPNNRVYMICVTCGEGISWAS